MLRKGVRVHSDRLSCKNDSNKLNENNLQDIPRNVFKTYRLLVSLDLSNNKISRIDVDAFCSCSSLKNLSLQNNTLQSNEESFPIGSFSPLVNLRSLHLFGMNLRDVKYTTTEICSNLYSLVRLEIDIWDGFQLSQHCSQLQNLKLLTLNVRQRIKFLNQSFEVLDGLPIDVLRLQGTLNDGLYSKPIEVGVLRPLHQLKTLEIDSFCVCYISYLLRTIIYPFRNKTMDLIFKNLIDLPFQSISSSDLKYIKDICVRKLIMTTVSIESFDAGEFNSSPVLSSVSILQTLKFWVKYVQDVCTVCRRPISNIREGWVGSLRSSSKQQLVAYKLLLRYILLLMHQQSE